MVNTKNYGNSGDNGPNLPPPPQNPQAISLRTNSVKSFCIHYGTCGEIKVKCKKFLLLKQGSITTREYLTKFKQLSCYAPRVDEDA